jgi:hypothetical protein
MKRLALPIALAALVVSAAGVAWSQLARSRTALPAPPILPNPRLESTCANDVEHVSSCSNGVCALSFNIPCSPYGCAADGKTCKDSCVSDADCALDGRCDTTASRCATMSVSCTDDFTVRVAYGDVMSCSPYRCIGGSCADWCTANLDCHSGWHCDTSTQRCKH